MLVDWLRQRADSTPEQVGLVFSDTTTLAEQAWTFRALDQQVEELAAWLASAGVQPGGHVAVLLLNCPEYVFIIHALARLGAVLVALNTRQTAVELAWQASRADCSMVICNSQTQAAAAQISSNGLNLLNLDVARPTPFIESYGPQSSRAERGWALERVQAILFTSGTTGQPKGAQLTFGNHLWSATASAFRLSVDPGDRWLVTLPLFHAGGLSVIFRSVLYGTTLVIQNGFHPPAVLQTIASQGVSLISLVPTMLQRLLDVPGGAEVLSSLRYILLGGAAAPHPLLERALQAGLNLALTYGMTETASQLATATPAETRRKPGSVGKPLAFCQARILDEAGATLPAGQIGQIAISGPNLMSGYYPSDSNPLSGEFQTGDLGYLDEDGDLWVIQRRHDLILTGGENVYPAEVEAVLLSHPQIDSACVVGLENPEWGQQVAAAVAPRPGQLLHAQDLIDYCRQRLAGYKVPRQVIFLDRLPQTETGKVLRSEIIALFQEQV
jgi:O-succinylbenzoic acid--CoA ligase